ncbi:hypothetical protein DL93DRAFT_2088125 [Clavulina sp. PMI_390]|nr:hypothetical protein DL93DRAFT_2088125 [Clavulina sp. PMI_390]
MSRSSASSPWTHSFKHLLNEKPYIARKTSRRFPFTSPKQTKGIAHPRDRIKFWNVQVGDKIGIFRGTYRPDEGKRNSVYEVHDVDKRKNLVELKDLPSKGRSLQPTKGMARVHYSNVGLYLGKFNVNTIKDGETVTEEQDVFATRIFTTTPKWDPRLGHFVWRRFAASTWPPIEGYEKLPFSQRRRARETQEGRSGMIEIPWPVQKRWEAPKANDLDTELETVFLVRELANPNSRMKKQSRWRANLEREDRLQQQMLSSAMNLPENQGRRKAVVRREIIFRWQARLEKEKSEKARLAWVKRGGEDEMERKIVRKARKEERKERQLRELTLEKGIQGQIVPKEAQVVHA